MAQNNRIKLKNKETGETYHSRKNKKGSASKVKLSLKKYSAKLRKHVVFKESK